MDTTDYIAILAVLVSFVSLYRTRKQNEIENRFNEISSRLAEMQLSVLQREEQEKNSADLSAYFYKDYKNNYRIAITNHGLATAHDVSLSIDVSDGSKSPLIGNDIKGKLPAEFLHPGHEIYLLTAISMGMPTVFDATLTWKNPDGNEIHKQIKLTLRG